MPTQAIARSVVFQSSLVNISAKSEWVQVRIPARIKVPSPTLVAAPGVTSS